MSGIDRQRLLDDLHSLAAIGKVGKGVNRLALGADDIAARQWLVQRMTDAGLDARLDDIGNVYGRDPRADRTILMGSHSDTVPNGGWLDGSLGIIYGIEIVRALRQKLADSRLGVDVLSFIDEEGTYLSWFGSRSFCGEIKEADIANARNASGERLSTVLATMPFRGNPPARFERGRHIAYFEPHIEQGPKLDTEGKKIGVVTGIVGIRNYYIKFEGRADHAGTTPMAMRRDAAWELIRFTSQLVPQFERVAGPETVWNIGNVIVQPGRRSVVPSAAELAFQFRDLNFDRLHKLEGILEEAMAALNRRGPVTCSCSTSFAHDPVNMDSQLGENIAAAAADQQATFMWMHSGAGHDAAALAHHVPTAMMFIPSIGGRSHSTDEDTSEDDIVLGAKVALAAVERMLGLV